MNQQNAQYFKGKFVKPDKIPNDWERVKIKDICQLTTGSTPKTERTEYYDGDIAWVSSGELDYNKIIRSNEYITEEAVNASNLKIHPIGTFLIAIAGLEAKGTRGRCAILDIPAATNQSCMAFYPNQKILSYYLFYYWQQFSEKIIFSLAQGTKQQSLNKTLVESIVIELPPLEEQKKIIAILSHVDDLLFSYEENINLVRKLRNGLVNKLLITGVKNSKFKKVKWFFGKEIEIPINWEVKTCEEISAKVLDGEHNSPPFADHGIPYISAQHIKSEILFDDCKYITYDTYQKLIKRCNPEVDDILITVKGTIGNCKKININDKFSMDRNVGLIKPDHTKIYPLFLEIKMKSDLIQKQILSVIDNSVIPSLYLKKIKDLKFIVPSIPEQIEIATIVSNIDSQIVYLENKKSSFISLKKGLMQKLLTGQIRVK